MKSHAKITSLICGGVFCTLEGFDDIRAVEAAIADYLRDVATPDTDALARFVAQKLARPVEAAACDGAIHLRALTGGARVVKVSRADLDAVLAGISLEEVPRAASPFDLSAEDEADLQRELAEIEADMEQMGTRTHQASEAPPAPHAQDGGAPPCNTGAAGTSNDQPTTEPQSARIFDDTNSQQARPEARESRRAILHLPCSARDMDAASFANHAARVNASSPADLLEAAAAFICDIEGTESFSRTALMQKLDEAHDGPLSTKDRLRAFGTLLRQGKLHRLKGGVFAVTQATGFRQPR